MICSPYGKAVTSPADRSQKWKLSNWNIPFEPGRSSLWKKELAVLRVLRPVPFRICVLLALSLATPTEGSMVTCCSSQYQLLAMARKEEVEPMLVPLRVKKKAPVVPMRRSTWVVEAS